MKKYSLLFLFVIALSVKGYSQDLKISVNKKGKVGFVDNKGQEVIKCQYESAQPFKDGVAIVVKSGKCGMITATGEEIFPLKYSSIQPWTKDMYIVKKGKKVGLADRQGLFYLPVKYSNISQPNCYGKALISLGGKATQNEKKTYMANAKYGIIDTSGNILVTPKYKGLYEFSYNGDGIYPYYEGKRLEFSYHNITDTLITDCEYLGFSNYGINIYNAGIIDGSGKELLKKGKYHYIMEPQNNMVRYYMVKRKQTKCGYFNIETGEEFQVVEFKQPMDEIKFWTHGDFTGEIAPVNGDSWAFVDKTGKEIRQGYSTLKHCKTIGLWAAKGNDGTWDVFDEYDRNVTPLTGYSDINFPTNDNKREIYSVQKSGNYGCVTKTGEVVVPFEYDFVMGNSHDYVVVKKNGLWGILNSDNSLVVPIKYANVVLPEERNTNDFWVQKADSLYYHFSVNTNKEYTKGYKTVFSNFSNGISHVAPVNMNVEDSQINRAQTCAPNTHKDILDKIDMDKASANFGYLVGSDDKEIMNFPVSIKYRELVINEIEKLGKRTLSETEKKRILLDVTHENRSYDLKSTISESEWNY